MDSEADSTGEKRKRKEEEQVFIILGLKQGTKETGHAPCSGQK